MKTSILSKVLFVVMLFAAHKAHAHDFEVNGIYYGISIFNKNTAYVTHKGTDYNEAKEYTGSVVIPESVTYNGKTYPVASIGGYAFAGCDELTSVVIPSSITTINQNAFNGCTGLQSVECKSTTPPVCKENVFSGVSTQNVRLTVPAESGYGYMTTEPWKNFGMKYEINGDTEISVLNYNIISNTEVEVTSNIPRRYRGDIVIPSETTIDGKKYTVARIGEEAFDNCSDMTSIVIPNTITSIGYESFFACTGLTSVEIPNSVVDIGENAFNLCSGLVSIKIPNSIKSIGNYAFYQCDRLSAVYITDIEAWCKIDFGISSSNPVSYAKNLYLNNELLTNLEIPNTINTIKPFTFYNCINLNSVTIPSSVTKIENFAFCGCCGLISVEIPNSVKSIGLSSFSGCSGLKNVTIGNSVKNIDNFAFEDCTILTSVKSYSSIPPSCETYVFSGVETQNIPLIVPAEGMERYESSDPWKNFKIEGVDEIEGLTYKIISDTEVEVIEGDTPYEGDIVIPSEVTIEGKKYTVISIGPGAFKNCIELTNIMLGNKITSIGERAFYGCSGLNLVTIPNSVTYIDDAAFTACTNLATVNFNATNCLTMGNDYLVFGNNTTLTTLNIGENVTNIPAHAFQQCGGLTTVTIPNSVKKIDEYSFSRCSKLTSVSISNSVDTVGIGAFSNCNSLTSVYISDIEAWCKINFANGLANPLHYAKNLYVNNEKVISLEIPNTITEIKDFAFVDYVGLTSVTIPNSVISIGISAFYGCTGLTSVTIPNSVTSIDSWTFSHCTNLSSIVVENGNTVYDSRDNCNAIIETATNKLISGCKNTIIPNSVTTIGDDAFYGCTGLTSIIIPNSVTSIGDGAFDDTGWYNNQPDGVLYLSNCCLGIKGGYQYSDELTVKDGTRLISDFAFLFRRELTLVTIPNSVTSIGVGAFTSGEIISIVVKSGNAVYDSRENCNAIIETATNTLISGCKTTVIPNSVASIGNYAFYDCYGWFDIAIPNSVTSIGDYAFCSCDLSSVTIPNSVTSIGEHAFDYCYNLSSVYSLNPIPPFCGTDVFGSKIQELSLIVPKESVSLYQSADTWKDFGSIIGGTNISLGAPMSDVEEVNVEDVDAPVEYYNLQGVRVENPSHGLYIKRQGGHTTKVVL